ncbi:hypothetical protein [Vagococcus fluvialis]|uniref:hypothetical protein n=1 Tax=Vagococcus fluvialis TaxID=2738 RepID=UPI001D0AB26A|nr:hypothetical protein [Vagococcus fluvialis]UDM70308.1 hypothetical protein K5L00_09185 [Vagococcus fluvialis]UDM77726.1 hypothetical protein K5K98_04725 [Vagococcus fluvialis]UDM81997.1 hypothetical protein K5K96_11665 [Vagococcus fluvialis]
MEEYRTKKYFELDQKIKRLEILLEKTNKEMFQQTLATHLSYSGERGIHVEAPRIEAAFKTMIRKQYPLLKEYGDKHIIESIENVKEIEAAKTRVREVLKELLEENNKLDQLLNERWDKATEEVCSTKIEHYADLIDSYYIAPSITRFPNGLSSHFISELEEEIKHQEE